MLRVVLLLPLLAAACLAQTKCGAKPPQKDWAQYIVAGREAEQNTWPWQLSLQLKRDDGSFSHICGAVLIDEFWALTAAHCTNPFGDPDAFLVVGGGHYLDKYTGKEQTTYVSKIIEHKDFKMNTLIGVPNDIALLRLAKPMDTSKPEVQAACIPRESTGDFAGNDNCWISGWGKTWWMSQSPSNTLQEAHIPIPSNDECKAMHVGVILGTHICAGTGTPNACSGDSGGPMHCLLDDTWYVTGLTSWGMVTCSGVPGVYTRVSSYYDWIGSNTGLW